MHFTSPLREPRRRVRPSTLARQRLAHLPEEEFSTLARFAFENGFSPAALARPFVRAFEHDEAFDLEGWR